MEKHIIKQTVAPSTPCLPIRHAPYINRRVALPPHRINPLATPVMANSHHIPMVTTRNGIRVGRNQLSLSEEELEFYESVDSTLSLTENLHLCFKEHRLDLGRCGCTLLKYKNSGRLDDVSYDESVQWYNSYSFTISPSVSDFGVISPAVLQISQAFVMNVKTYEKPKPPKNASKSAVFTWKPSFGYVDAKFQGSYPFKTEHVVSMKLLGIVPQDTQRAISWIIKNVLAQILSTPDSHQQFAVRSVYAKNAKTNRKDLPLPVSQFIEDYCMRSFGYPAEIRLPAFSFDSLASDYPALTAKLGATREECLKKFPILVADAHHLHSVIFAQLQRAFSDLRNSIVKQSVRTISGVEIVVNEFVRMTQQPLQQFHPEEAEDFDVGDEHLESRYIRNSSTPEAFEEGSTS